MSNTRTDDDGAGTLSMVTSQTNPRTQTTSPGVGIKTTKTDKILHELSRSQVQTIQYT